MFTLGYCNYNNLLASISTGNEFLYFLRKAREEVLKCAFFVLSSGGIANLIYTTCNVVGVFIPALDCSGLKLGNTTCETPISLSFPSVLGVGRVNASVIT